MAWADCVYRQWFLEVFLGPLSNVNDRIMPMSDAVSSEGTKTSASNKGLRPCPLHTEISPVSLNLLMMLCTVDYKICIAFCNLTLRNVVFKVFHNIFYTLFHRLKSICPSLLQRETLPL